MTIHSAASSATGGGVRPDVVVVGGGAIGLASAWRLAQRGAAVTVVDPDPGGGASGVAAGMLAPITEARMGEEPLLRLNLASWSRWPSFAAEVEGAADAAIGYRADGTLVVALDADDRVALEELAARHQAMGLAVTPLRGREVRRLEPGLAPGVRAGFLAAGERSVDPSALVGALRRASTAAGVEFVAAEVEHIATGGPGGSTPRRWCSRPDAARPASPGCRRRRSHRSGPSRGRSSRCGSHREPRWSRTPSAGWSTGSPSTWSPGPTAA
jgi:glycine oxidase